EVRLEARTPRHVLVPARIEGGARVPDSRLSRERVDDGDLRFLDGVRRGAARRGRVGGLALACRERLLGFSDAVEERRPRGVVRGALGARLVALRLRVLTVAGGR